MSIPTEAYVDVIINSYLKSTILILSAILLSPGCEEPEAFPEDAFVKAFGIHDGGIGHSVHQTFDGGYIIIGDTWTGCDCTRDILHIKMDASGSEIWIKTFGDPRNDRGYSGQQMADGGYTPCILSRRTP
ncbi:hypothetical protein ACFL4K_03655 [Candidatus Neomarinimicrobiota bacterium]